MQSDAKTLQLWYGEDYSKRVDVARNIHGVYLGGAVVDPSRNRVITIGCDHVDMNMHSDVMTGAGAVMSMSFAGRPLGDAFRFSDTPTDISRDAYCQYVAVTTSSGGLHVFKNRIAGLEHEWRVNPHVGPTPGVSVSGDGQCVASSGCLGVSCFRLIDGSPVFQVKVDNKPTGSSFVGNEHLCYIIKGELSVIMLSDPSNTKKSMKVDEYVVRMGESSCGHGVVFLVDDGPGEPGRPRRTKVKYLDLQKAGLMEEASK